jgi:DNA replication and repair protein RecF
VQLLAARIPLFRNLDGVELQPGPRATVLVGSNGQGKTNTLEALWFASTLRPLRATRLSELVPFGKGAEGVEIHTEWQEAGGPRSYEVRLLQGERLLDVDGKRVHSLEDYLGRLSVVAFTPDDLTLVKGAPDERRRFLDRAVFGRAPAYLSESRDYLRALKARNKLLREHASPALRAAFDAPLARLGARLWRRRLALVDELAPLAARAFEAVGRLSVPLNVRYRHAGLELEEGLDERTLEARLLEGLESRLLLDSDRGFTSVGPHADDLQLQLGDRSARLYGSQGQQRAIVLSLKIGEIENLRAGLGRFPLLLLDDVSSELDPERNGFLMSYLRGLESQVLLTTTDPALVASAAGDDAVVYEVSQGRVTRA